MHTAPIAALPTDLSGLPPSAPPGAPGTPTFSDMLASATSSLAAFALLPTSTSGALSGVDNPPPAPKKNPSNDNAAVPIALPAPVQAPVAPAAADASGSSGSPATTAAASGTQQTQQSAQTTATGSTGTGGASSGSAQSTNGASLPPMATELNTRVALGAQALLSQPSQVLATLPHGALQTPTPALSPNLSAAAHGATATDPTAALPKLATSATLAAATPSTTPQTLETALQTATAETAASTATTAMSDAAAASASDPTDQTDPALAATPAPAAVPLPATDAAANLGDALPPAVAASALDQVAANLSQVGKLGLSQIEIQLKPAALGTVDVKLELTHDGRVAAVISADRSDTLMQLQRGSGELQQALRDAGLQTDSGSLSFNLRSDAQTSDQSGRQPSYAAPPSAAASASDDVAGPVPLAGASQSAHSGLLNIQV